MSAPETAADAAWLDAQRWVVGSCARCNHPRVKTMAVGHIEGNSGPGYEIRFCRPCVKLTLKGARAEQARGYRTRLPPALSDAMMSSILQQVAEHEAPEPDPAELAEGKAKLMAYMDKLNAEASG